MGFSVDAVRGRFPALNLADKGKRRIYLDNPAGTQVPQAVADAVAHCLLTTNANLGGYFETTVAAGQVVDDAAGAPSVGEVDTGELLVVLSGATMQGKPPDLLPDLGARMVAQIMLEPLGDADLVTLRRKPTLPFSAR